jgi:hypothetical protein
LQTLVVLPFLFGSFGHRFGPPACTGVNDRIVVALREVRLDEHHIIINY